MKQFKWIVSDLDGTLIHHKNNENVIYNDVILELHRVYENHKFTIATGRHYKDVLEINKKFGIKIPKDSFIVGANGCQIYSLSSRKLIFDKTLKDPIVQKELPKLISFLDQFYPNSTLVFAYGGNENIYFIKNNSNKFEEMVKVVRCFEENDDIFNYSIANDLKNIGKITKFCINFLNDIENPLELIERLKSVSDKFDYANTGLDFMEIIHKDINKSTALDYINKKYYNFDRNDILLFGDSGNDIEMMDYAGTAITRDDARTEIKSKANLIYPGGPSKFVKNALIDLIK